jgi:hypothetical protein
VDRNLSPERVRFNFRVDLVASMIGSLFFVGAFMPVLVRRMGGSEFEVALVLAAGPIGHIVSPVLAALFQRCRTPLVLASTGIAAKLVFLAGLLLAETPLLLSVAWMALFVVSLGGIAANTMLVQGMYPDDQRATAMARVRICGNLVGIAATMTGGALLQSAAEPMPILVAATLVSLASSACLLLLRFDEPRQRPRISPLGLGAIAFRDAIFRRYLIATSVLGFGNAMGATVYALLLVDRFDAPTGFIGTLAGVQAAATMVGFFFWGKRIDRGSSIRLAATNATLMLGLPLVYLLAPAAPFLLPAAIIAGLTTACADLVFHTSMIQLAPRGQAGQYMAAQSFILGIRATIAPFVGSAILVATNPTTTLALVLACVAAGALLLRTLGAAPARRERPVPAAAGEAAD